MKYRFLLLLFLLLGLLTRHVRADDFDVAAKASFAVEVSTGKILYEKNSQETLPVGPTSKLLTAYLIYQQIEAGKLKWSDQVTISDYAYQLTTLDVSNVPLEKKTYTIKELVTAMLVTSANGATVALAEHVAGTEPKFVDMMNKQLQDWGFKTAKMVNATGLNNSVLGEENSYPGGQVDDENQMSAKALALVAYNLLTEYPDIIKLTQKSEAQFDKETIYSYNLMLPKMPYFREGVDGLATGTTELAGSSFVASAKTNSMRVITVILNADGWQEDTGARFMATNTLLNHIANNYYPLTILKKHKTLDGMTTPILDGKEEHVTVVSQKPLTIIKAIGDTDSPVIDYTPKQKATYAPIQKGDALGQFTYRDKHLIGEGYLKDFPSVSALAKSDVAKSFFLKVWWNHFVTYVNDNL